MSMHLAPRFRAMLLILLIAVSCLSVSEAATARPNKGIVYDASSSNAPQPWLNYTQTEHVFAQTKVDQFNLHDDRVYGMRYWIVDQFWNKQPESAVLLLLCGEYECPGVNPARLFPLQMAYELNALVVIVEHRFFGKSWPTKAFDVQSFSLLNSRQALNDWAQFVTYFKKTSIDGVHLSATKWFVIGGSYPGALSAWFRLKYPHLVVGSLASSAVVQAILDFTAFDEQVERSTGPECSAALRSITIQAEQSLPASKQTIGCSPAMHDGDLLLLLADSAVEGVQYGGRVALCAALLPAYRTLKRAESTHASSSAYVSILKDVLLDRFLNYTKNVFFAGGNGCGGYDRRALMSTVPTTASDRSWLWQVCTEFGWWQVARTPGRSIRSQQVNHTYYQGLCRDVFNLTTLPAIESTNLYYGGWNLSTSNTMFTNGIEDVWQWASVRTSLSASVPARVTNCTDCAHCVELYTPVDQDAKTLQETRTQVMTFARQLLFPATADEGSSTTSLHIAAS